MKFSQIPVLVAAVTVCLSMGAQAARCRMTIINDSKIDWTVKALKWCYNDKQNPAVTVDGASEFLLSKETTKGFDFIIYFGEDRKGIFGFELIDKSANNSIWVVWRDAIYRKGKDWVVMAPIKELGNYKFKDIEWKEGGDFEKTLILNENIGRNFFN